MNTYFIYYMICFENNVIGYFDCILDFKDIYGKADIIDLKLELIKKHSIPLFFLNTDRIVIVNFKILKRISD